MDVTFHESQSYFQSSSVSESPLQGEQWYEEEVTLPGLVEERNINIGNEGDQGKEKEDGVENEGNQGRTPTKEGEKLLVYSRGNWSKSGHKAPTHTTSPLSSPPHAEV